MAGSARAQFSPRGRTSPEFDTPPADPRMRCRPFAPSVEGVRRDRPPLARGVTSSLALASRVPRAFPSPPDPPRLRRALPRPRPAPQRPRAAPLSVRAATGPPPPPIKPSGRPLLLSPLRLSPLHRSPPLRLGGARPSPPSPGLDLGLERESVSRLAPSVSWGHRGPGAFISRKQWRGER